jgi:hypothetical protein
MTAELTRMLQKLQMADGLDLAAVISMDGLLIDVAAVPELDPQHVAASASNAMLMARAMGGDLERGEPVQTFVEYQHGMLLLAPLDEDLGLLLLAPRETNLGRLRLVARRYAQELLKAATV